MINIHSVPLMPTIFTSAQHSYLSTHFTFQPLAHFIIHAYFMPPVPSVPYGHPIIFHHGIFNPGMFSRDLCTYRFPNTLLESIALSVDGLTYSIGNVTLTFMIRFRNLRKVVPCSGLVRKSATISPVGQ